jgi:SAM-dependent methyltransferase
MEPSTPLEARSRAFYDRIAPGYDVAMETPLSRGLRECFWRRADAELAPGSRLLDFGAGSGLDAEHFAARGLHVTAYEPSAGMLAMLRERCAAQVGSGAVVPLGGTFDELEAALSGIPPFDGVVCNFAVFSMVARLAPVFRLFGRVVRPGGRVLISIQNPWYPGDVRSRAFLKALLGVPAHGVMRYRSADIGYTNRYLPLQLRRAARPEFRSAPAREPFPAECRRRFGLLGVFRLVVLERV